MLPAYVVHAMKGRARLRHDVFLNETSLARAQRVLDAEPDVRETRHGHASLLLFLQPWANLKTLCDKLEEELPELKLTSLRSVRYINLSQMNGLSPRRLELRILTCISLLCLISGLFDSSKMHVLSGLAFAALAGRHVWKRRTAL